VDWKNSFVLFLVDCYVCLEDSAGLSLIIDCCDFVIDLDMTVAEGV